MPTETFIDSRNGQRYKVEYDTRIGGGSQGEVFVVRKVDNRKDGDHLLKIYNQPTQAVRQHAAQFVEHLNSHSLHKEGLVGLPRRCVLSEDGQRIAVFMAFVPGQTMETRDVYQWLQGQPLITRLELARQVAQSIATLHQAKIVHADIAEPNVMLDEQQVCPYLIDADGGGILDQKGQYQLRPVVHGHATASWNAPELYAAGKIPSIETDNWSLAVLILKILVPVQGLDPFAGLEVFVDTSQTPGRDCRDAALRWPEYQADDPSLQRGVDIIKRALLRLGPNLKSLFTATFDTPGRLQNPRLRTLSNSWSRELDIAGRWCLDCECGEQVVANGVTTCAFCNKPLHHAQVKVGAATWLVNREGFSLVGRDLGFRDGNNGKYEVLRFSRVIQRNRSKLKVEIVTKGKSQELDAGVHQLQVRSNDGRSRTVVQVTVE